MPRASPDARGIGVSGRDPALRRHLVSSLNGLSGRGGGVAQRIRVVFDGCDSGVAELNWGQLAHWRNAGLSGITESAGGMMKLAEGTTVDDIVKLLRYIVTRHQALRTRIFADENGRPR